MSAPINTMIDNVATPNEPPENLKEGQVWATHSGVLKMGEIELRCHVLSSGQRIFDAEDVEKFFGIINQ